MGFSPRSADGLLAGDPWPGPHVGIRYTLTAGGRDIKYEEQVTPSRTRDHLLSDYHGEAAAVALANRLSRTKGFQGGRIYINEVGEFFAPMDEYGNVAYVYLGALDEDPWFPAPDVPRS